MVRCQLLKMSSCDEYDFAVGLLFPRVQCSARTNISYCFVAKLEECKVYNIEGFTITPKNDKYQIRHGDERAIELEGYTVVKEVGGSKDYVHTIPIPIGFA